MILSSKLCSRCLRCSLFGPWYMIQGGYKINRQAIAHKCWLLDYKTQRFVFEVWISIGVVATCNNVTGSSSWHLHMPRYVDNYYNHSFKCWTQWSLVLLSILRLVQRFYPRLWIELLCNIVSSKSCKLLWISSYILHIVGSK